MSTKINVLLTGASGAVGREVLKQLYEANTYNITVFDIKTSKSVKILSQYSHAIEIIYGNIANALDIKAACTKKDVVIHLAAIIPPLADEQPALSNRVNVIGTENLIRALEHDSPNAFLIYSSSISVYGDRVINPYIKVSDPLIPSEGDAYALTKITAEHLIQTSNLNWTIFRLCAIMGEHKVSKLMFHQPLQTYFEISSIEDTARAFVHAIQKKTDLSKKTYNLGGGETCRCTYEEFLIRSFEMNGLGKPNFAAHSFADKNFHCGFYQDGNDLEEIIHFRNDTLESFFQKEKENIFLPKTSCYYF